MSEGKTCAISTTSDVKLATLEAVPDAEMRAARLAHIGELAVAWRKMNKEAERRERLDDSDQDLARLWRAEDDAYLALIKACDEVKP